MPKGKRVPDKIKQEAVRLVKAGMTQKVVAKRLGVGYGTVNEAVRLAKLEAGELPKTRPEPQFVSLSELIPLLVPGKVYTIREIVDEGTGKRHVVRRRRMRYLEPYPHVALFVSKEGIHRSYQYWELMKMLEVSGK